MDVDTDCMYSSLIWILPQFCTVNCILPDCYCRRSRTCSGSGCSQTSTALCWRTSQSSWSRASPRSSKMWPPLFVANENAQESGLKGFLSVSFLSSEYVWSLFMSDNLKKMVDINKQVILTSIDFVLKIFEVYYVGAQSAILSWRSVSSVTMFCLHLITMVTINLLPICSSFSSSCKKLHFWNMSSGRKIKCLN